MEQKSSGGYADLACFMAINAPKRDAQKPEEKHPTPVQLRNEKRRLLKEMRQLVKTINAIEVRDHIDSDDLAEWLFSIRRDLSTSIEKLEEIQ